jgi:hypothetical protein
MSDEEEISTKRQITPEQRRILILAGAVVGVAVLAGGGYVLLSSGSSTPAATSAPASGGGGAPAPTTTPSPSPTGLPVQILAGSAQDPFGNLPGVAGSAASSGNPSASSSSSSSSSPQPTASPTSTATHPSPAPSPTTTPLGQHHTVQLVAIHVNGSSLTWQIMVDGKSYTVSQGKTFAGDFEVWRYQGTQPTIRYGTNPYLYFDLPIGTTYVT